MEEKVCVFGIQLFYNVYYILGQVNQFKNGELLRVKMETKENLTKELQKKRTEVRPCISWASCHLSLQLEQQYQDKIEQLSKKERDMVQRLQRREEVTFSPTSQSVT